MAPPETEHGMIGGSGRSGNPLVAKLSRFVLFSREEIGVLEALCANQERFNAGVNLAEEGDPTRPGFVVTRGLACRCRLMADGRRQILTFLIPGDFFDLHAFLLRSMDHSIITIAATRLATIPRDKVTEIAARYPRIGAAFWWSAMQESAMLREHIVTLGRRNARGRVAHLFCELVWRQRAVGISEDHAIRLPLTQLDIADTLGLTAVHVNRVLQGFRREGLITLVQRRLQLHDVRTLQDVAGLTPDYLHLAGAPAESGRYLDRLERREAANRERAAGSC
jgi:CRP-like cAMP-binding protein